MGKTAFLFPGQGSQYVGMGQKLYENFTTAKEIFEEANEALGFDLKGLCFEGNLEELTRTENAQPAIVTVSTAAYRVFQQETGMIPDFCAGHSLGEFSALTCAGAIKFSDTLQLVRQRGKLMQEAATGVMAAVTGIGPDIIDAECQKVSVSGKVAVVSNYNSPEQTVISGNDDAIKTVSARLNELGAKVIPLKVSAAFHSPLMAPAAEQFEQELRKYQFKQPQYSVIANVDARPYQNPDEIQIKLKSQMVTAVHWRESIQYLESQGVNLAIELGPKNVLTNLMGKNSSVIKACNCENADNIINFKKTILPESPKPTAAKSNISVVTKCLAIAVCTKNNNWDNEAYQRGVVEPYKKIQQMQELIEKEGRQPTMAEMESALQMLRSVFMTKQTPATEQGERLKMIFEQTGTDDLFPGFVELQ